MKILQTLPPPPARVHPEDADALALVLSDPETMRYYPAPYDRAGVEQWIERNRQRYQDDGVGLWAMELMMTQELIGDCGIHPAAGRRRMLLRNRIPPAPRLLGPGPRHRSRHRLPRLGIRAPENRALDFPDSPRESALTPRRRA